jgi:hypothetical protein
MIWVRVALSSLLGRGASTASNITRRGCVRQGLEMAVVRAGSYAAERSWGFSCPLSGRYLELSVGLEPVFVGLVSTAAGDAKRLRRERMRTR